MYGSPKSDRNSALRLCVYNLYQTGRSRRTLYNRCMTPRLLTDVHQAVENNLQGTPFSYTSFMDLYGYRKSDANSSIRLWVYNPYQTVRSRRTLYTMCTTTRALTDMHHAVENNLQ